MLRSSVSYDAPCRGRLSWRYLGQGRLGNLVKNFTWYSHSYPAGPAPLMSPALRGHMKFLAFWRRHQRLDHLTYSRLLESWIQGQ